MRLLIVILGLQFSLIANSETLRPKTVKDFQRSSVRILNIQENSGGTGSIFRSSSKGSEILTNKHVCRLVEQGGIVEQEGRKYLVTHYKKFPKHDLCLIKIKQNLGISLVLAANMAKQSSVTKVSGHPNLLPHILTSGHLSGNMNIKLLTGLKKCTDVDKINRMVECIFFGGIPIIDVLNANVVSNLIKAGSSGSAIFNEDGEIVGLVFAGSGRNFSYGFIVPQEYVSFFIKTRGLYMYTKVGTKNPLDENISDRVFSYKKCDKIKESKDPKLTKVKELCSTLSFDSLWRE